MKRAEKIGLGLLVALFGACLIAAAVLVFTDSGLAFLKSSSRIEKQASALRALDQRYPFTPPPGRLIPEDRLLAYLDVCCEVRAQTAPLESWRESHDGLRVLGQPVFQGEGGDLVADFLQGMTAALERGRMGPDEWQWIANELEFAKEDPSGLGRMHEVRQTVDGLQKTAQDPDLPPEDRKRLEDHIARLQTVAVPSPAAAEANAALCARYADRLSACAVGRRCRMILAEVLPSLPGRPRAQVVVVNP